MKPLALKVNATIENRAPLHIASSRMYNYRGTRVKVSDYPLGQNFRGAFGYIFLDMKSDIAETYENNHPRIYFRDALVLHTDGGVFEPNIIVENNRPQIIFRCRKCNFKNKNPLFREPKIGIHLGESKTARNMFLTDIISRQTSFNFEAILSLKSKTNEEQQKIENYSSEFIASLRFVEQNGLYIGKRNSKGMGKIIFKNLSFRKITLEGVKKRAEQIEEIFQNNRNKFSLHLMSDTITNFPLTGEDIIRNVKTTYKFLNPDYKPYKNPIIILKKQSVEYKVSVSFMDLKQTNGVPRFDSPKGVISRGTVFTYSITGASKDFYIALAMAEMLRGIGKRTSFGKGEFKIM